MKVILLKDIPHLGQNNDIKDVSDGYARNFLIPRALAEPATDARLAALKTKQDTLALKKSLARHEYEILAEKMKTLTLRFAMKMGERGKAFGSVTVAKITDAMRKEGIAVEKEWVVLDGAIKTTGEHAVGVRFPHDIGAQIKIIVEPE
ncbi:MAG: large subunit ribosomal protein L9 [Parcubacteria group bacterium Greene0714_36]|nr:MAG: large subunit ribosomal protein L9 [Parcubacteria group bacterium Greene0714_36]